VILSSLFEFVAASGLRKKMTVHFPNATDNWYQTGPCSSIAGGNNRERLCVDDGWWKC